MKSKKAQIQMMETIAVLLIFFVIIIIGFIFYVRTAGFGQAQKITKDQELQSIRVSQAISFLPELQCSAKNIVKDNCFDKYKLDAFEELVDEQLYYELFYYSDISLKEIYPGEKEWFLYNRTRNTTSYRTVIPILLYNATSKTNAFGLLNVRYYTIT